MLKSLRAGLFLFAVSILLPAVVVASPIVTIEVAGGSGPTDLVPNGSTTSNGDVTSWSLDNPFEVDGIVINSWTAELKEDPFVTNNINVTNTTGVNQTFIATVLLTIPLFNYDSVINSSIGLTATDSNGNNILLFGNNGATPIYQGTVNGTPVLSLNPAGLPFSTASCFIAFPGCTATGAAGTAFQLAGPGGATQIGITLTFDLSPGDSAGLTSRFEIVPEPSTALLLAGGLLALAGRRRRRSA